MISGLKYTSSSETNIIKQPIHGEGRLLRLTADNCIQQALFRPTAMENLNRISNRWSEYLPNTFQILDSCVNTLICLNPEFHAADSVYFNVIGMSECI